MGQTRIRIGAKKGVGANLIGGEAGIRTLGGSPLNGFQDRRFQPLSHLSVSHFSRGENTSFKASRKGEFFVFLVVLKYAYRALYIYGIVIEISHGLGAYQICNQMI
jgi:hypothetical protein